MARARLSLLAVLLLIVACGDEVGVPPFAARLAIEISGLPDGAAAPVTLDGPDGEAVAVSRSRVFDLLPPGEYVLRSETAALGFGNYYPDRLARTIRLDGGASRTLTVAYTGVLDRGGLRALPAGLPEDLATGDLAFAVAGPGGFAAVITPADSLDRLEPGTYQVTASRVDEGERVFAPWPETVPVEVTAGAWAVAEPAYAAAFDVSLDLQVAHVELTQAVQRDDGSVPLVAGRDAYLRVFGIATEADQVAPPVRVEWLRDGAVVASERVTRAAAGVPGDVVRDDLDASWNLPVPGSLVQAGLGVRVVIDPDGDVPEAVEANNTWPAAGDAAGFAVVARDPLPVRLVPVYQEVNGALGDVTGANAPDYVAASRQLLPTPAVDVDLHDVFTTSAPPLQADDGNRAWLRILTELTGLRAMEEHEGRHYYGVVRCTYDSGIAGLGRLPGYVAMGWDAPGSRTEVVAHELGHNLGLRHAPCGGPAGVDPDYPYVDALIGAWGFDVVGEVVHDPRRPRPHELLPAEVDLRLHVRAGAGLRAARGADRARRAHDVFAGVGPPRGRPAGARSGGGGDRGAVGAARAGAVDVDRHRRSWRAAGDDALRDAGHRLRRARRERVRLDAAVAGEQGVGGGAGGARRTGRPGRHGAVGGSQGRRRAADPLARAVRRSVVALERRGVSAGGGAAGGVGRRGGGGARRRGAGAGGARSARTGVQRRGAGLAHPHDGAVGPRHGIRTRARMRAGPSSAAET